MDFEPICRIVDTAIDLSLRDKRALLAISLIGQLSC